MNNWFGLLNPLSKMMMAAVLVFFPVMANVTRGLVQVEPGALELMRSYAASEWTILRKVRIPNALPYFFTALKIATTLSLIGAIVGEYFGGSTLGPRPDHRPERERPEVRRHLGARSCSAPLTGIVFYLDRRGSSSGSSSRGTPRCARELTLPEPVGSTRRAERDRAGREVVSFRDSTAADRRSGEARAPVGRRARRQEESMDKKRGFALSAAAMFVFAALCARRPRPPRHPRRRPASPRRRRRRPETASQPPASAGS